MKKLLPCALITALMTTSFLSMACDKKCVVSLKRSDGTVIKAKLSKEDCKKVSSLKQGESVKLVDVGVGLEQMYGR